MTTTNLGMTKPTVGADSDTWGGELNGDLDLIDAFAGKLMPGAEVTVASAATCDIGAAASTAVAISGTTTITSFGTVANCIRFVRFTGALTLTHNGTSLILLGGANQTTAAGDCAIFQSDGSGNWRQRAYFSAAYIPSAHTGTGSFAHAVSPQFSVPYLGAATGASLALNGATLGGRTLAVNGGLLVGTGDITISSGSLGVPGATFNADSGGGASWNLTGFAVSVSCNIGGITSTNGGGFTITQGTSSATLQNGVSGWQISSSLVKKKDIAPLPVESALDTVGALAPVVFRYKAEDESAPLKPGFIWEDVVEVFPLATSYMPEITRESHGSVDIVPESKTLALELFVPLIVQALKEQTAINSDLQKRITALEVQ